MTTIAIVSGVVLIVLMFLGYKLKMTLDENGQLTLDLEKAKSKIKQLNESAKSRRMDYLDKVAENDKLIKQVSSLKSEKFILEKTIDDLKNIKPDMAVTDAKQIKQKPKRKYTKRKTKTENKD